MNAILRPFVIKSSGDLARLGVAAERFLRKDLLAVECHHENAALPFDQFRFDAEFPRNFVRQTGGSRQVVSNHAVFDRHTSHLKLLWAPRTGDWARRLDRLDAL